MARTKQTARKSTDGLAPRVLRSRGAVNVPIQPPPSGSTRILRSNTAKSTLATSHASGVTKPTKRRARADPWTPKRKPNPNPRPRPRRPPPTHYTCRICIEEQPAAHFVPWSPLRRRGWTMESGAPPNCIDHLAPNPRKKTTGPVCKSCISASMSARLDMLGARQLYTGCLEPSCTQPWTHEFIVSYLSPLNATLEKFNLAMFQVWKQDAVPMLFTCVSPSCGAQGLPDPQAAGYPQVTCTECSHRSCAQCNVQWHPDQTCAEYAARSIDKTLSHPELETLKLMQTKDGRRCPNCALVIEKDGGCDSMLCMACHKYFNWESAPSVVAGQRKAVPYLFSAPYWDTPAPQECEMDGLLRTAQGVTV
ncbi:hypothetical protein ACN47E_006585 [Coniothyrium glycines]